MSILKKTETSICTHNTFLLIEKFLMISCDTGNSKHRFLNKEYDSLNDAKKAMADYLSDRSQYLTCLSNSLLDEIKSSEDDDKMLPTGLIGEEI